MATVFDVAKYILDKYGAMSAMKLQKLVFYSFEAWAKGPVCRELFNAHKGKFMLRDSNFLKPCAQDISRLNDEQRETIDVVAGGLIDLPPYRLSDMVHQEKPWLDARGDCHAGARCENVITKESMEDYYSEKW